MQVLLPKLDFVTRREHELSLYDEVPVLKTCVEFLEKHCRTLEAVTADSRRCSSRSGPVNHKANNHHERRNVNYVHHEANANKRHLPRAIHVASQKPSCLYCNKQHYIYTCPEFINLTSRQRYQHLQKIGNICINCLRPGHSATTCKSSGCKLCNARHSSLLHYHFFNAKLATQNQAEAANCVNQLYLSSKQVLFFNRDYFRVGCSRHISQSARIAGQWVEGKHNNGKVLPQIKH